jgi:hypothetical protein
MNQPIFVTGVERSGSSIIAKIFAMCGVHVGTVSTMYENFGMNLLMDGFLDPLKGNQLFPDIKDLSIPLDWNDQVLEILKEEGYKDGKWMCKNSKLGQMWPVWNYAFPNARWIIVRRRTGDIVESCIKTGYMTMFKEPSNLKQVGAKDETEGWKWWVHQYEKRFVTMIEAGVNCRVVWPERMVSRDYQQINETLEWLGLVWNDKIIEIIDPMLIKSRRKTQWHV